ncbi:amino acid adenylation domain-containing protein [Streptomyces sp. ET3-23]|uniref:amino acid adenylation domain-containing protein n=1 Tax=Streptomyces sp. ET3-23 TaxID=2885643 RepID=UPI001D0FC0EE|nr:non-ribosomal peptide synthetase [Streptomyces sp. ET3-23]MCC2274665.1 amino acid adenylation domain-containing protein [Streptomyces sp. ET3-23]
MTHVPHVPSDGLPLTAGQKDIWFDEKLTGGGATYNTAIYWDIRGPLDLDRFKAALARLAEESECLRARFFEVDGEPRQAVEELAELPLTVTDVSAEADPAAAARAAIRADLRVPFTIGGTEPLFRFLVHTLAEDRTFFCLLNHHLVSDGFSYVIYWQRLSAIYEAMTDGTSLDEGRFAPLHTLIEAEAAYDGSPRQERDRAYWEEHFADAPELVTLSRKDAEPAQTFLREETVLPEAIAERLRTVAWDARVTWQTVLVAALGSYTQRMTGTDDVLLSLPVTARVGGTMQAIPGMVVNYLPLRLRVRPDTTRGELLAATYKEFTQALKHQRHRVSKVRRGMGLSSDDRRPFGPFINMMPQIEKLAIGPCEAVLHSPSTGLVDDLEFTVADKGAAGIGVDLSGNESRYDQEEVRGHLERFIAYLDRFTAAPADERLGALELLAPGEGERLTRVLTGPERPEPYLGVVERVRARAAERPDAIAVTDDNGSLTYARLTGRASALSRRLTGSGLVAVLAEPGTDFVVAELGVLGAGRAFLPLDSRQPSARLAALLADSGATCLVVDPANQDLAGQLADEAGVPLGLLVLDGAEDEQTALAPVAGGPQDLAYVIFTSGSTGRPKGAMVQRGGMINHLLAKVEELSLTRADSLVHNAPVTFDITVWQTLTTLLVGGRIRVVSPDTAADPDALFGTIGAEGLTVLEVVPSLLRATLDAWDTTGSAPRLPALRWMISNGEALAPELCDRWFARYPAIPLVNMYGPTECSDDVTHAYVRKGDELDGVFVPIGRPLRNTRLHVLGDELQPVPQGVPGELFIGGAGVGRGYLGDPCRTATTFVPDPFAGGGARMYRTGDRVVLRADGQLDFIERRDHQVKIRGHRIELGEIETALRALPGISDAVVTAGADQAGHKRLIGYLVAADGTVDTGAVRDGLAATLPAYMIPAALVVLDGMPLTAHGKVDRKALPVPDFALPAAVPEAPRSREEEALCRVLAEVLGLPSVGPDDNFFALGGDSISSIQVVSRARKAGLIITSRDVFLHRTPAAIAAVARPVQEETAVVVQDGVGEVELTPIADQLREELGHLPGAAREFSQYVTVTVPAGADTARLETALQALLDTHDALRLKLTAPVPGLWSLEALPVGAVRAADVVTRVDVTGTGEDPLAAQIAAARARLRPEDGLMVQAVLLDAGADRPARLLIVVHHLAVDGVSWRILLPDLEAAWSDAAAGRTVRLDPVATSYRRWAKVLSEQARTARRVAELPLWAGQFGDDEPLFGGRPVDPARDTHGSAGRVRIALPSEQTAAVLTAVPAAFHAEVDEVLLTGLALAVAEWRRKRGMSVARTLVELEGHGREPVAGELDLSRTVGWFTSIHPVSLDLGEPDWNGIRNGGPGCGAALKRIKEQLRVLPGDGIGYGLLRHLNPQTAAVLARQAVPQIGFNYLGRFTVGTGGDWSMEAGASGQTAHPDTPLRHALEVVSMTEDRPEGPVLVADWTFPGGLLSEDDVRELADGWFRALGDLAAHAARPGAGGRTPSEFPLVSVDQREIENYERDVEGLTDILPLSPLQRGLLFQAEFDRHGMDAYTLQVIMDVEGPLDKAALRAAVAALLERNASLRACFRDRDAGDPLQLIPGTVGLPWSEVDLTGVAEADREAELVRRTDEEWLRRFDVARSPLTRFTVYDLGEDRHRVVWTAHHILVDGWSLSAVLARELVTLWSNGADASALPPVASVRGYLEWSAAQDKEAARTAWQAELAGVDEPTRLGPADRERVEMLPETWSVELSEDLTNALTSWAHARGLTMNTVAQGAWAVALGRLTGRKDVTFGAVVSGRPADLPDVEQMVGAFMHTLPVRVTLSPATTFEEMLTGLQSRQLALEPHQHLGLAEVQQSAGIGELFDTVVSFHNYPTGVLDRIGERIPGLSMLHWEARVIAEYPLALGVFPGRGLRLEAQYRPDVFDATQVESIVGRFVRVLEALAATPGARLGELDALGADERRQLLGDWSGTATAGAGELRPATELFEAHAARTPDATAVVYGDGGERTGYAELNERANRLARLLIGRGVGPEHVVAVMLPRSAEMVVAALAVLKAGAAYLPVDSAYPADRIAYMLDDARPVALLTIEEIAARLPGTGTDMVVLDAPGTAGELAGYAADDVTDAERTTRLTVRHPAYVIYTSGSTGRPKGVVVEHAGMLSMVASLVERFGLDSDTRVLQFASFSFDASVWEIMLALLNGGTLVVADEECRTPGRPLVDLINNARVNLAGLPPVVVTGLPEGSTLPADLRLAVAGEAVPAEVVDRWASSVRLYNGYGPTEAVVSSTVSGPLAGTGRPPIGRPTSAHRVYVLDRDLAPTAVGVVGELYVSGGLARGYLRRPDLTAQRFVADPYGAPGERMYRTGDLVRWLENGELDYLGRADDQVQLRGFRIELGEIASALLAQDAVAQATVTVREDESGDRRLVAYVVLADEAAVADGLREKLAESLPDYMVPSAVVALLEMPLTAQGKLDRKALPAPELGAATQGRGPRNPAEEILCGLFADVLGLDRVTIDDDFFDIGGHSLLATRLVSRARAALGIELPIRALFEARTVAALAGQLGSADAARPALAPAPAGTGTLLSFAQQRLWFLNRREGKAVGTYNSPMTFRLSGRLNPDALQAALRDVAGRHEVLRTVIPETDGVPSLRVLDIETGSPALKVRHLTEDGLAAALAAEYDLGFDLTAEPPLRVRLFSLGKDEHVLLLVFHHIAFDGWSMAPLLADLSAAYRARCAGRAPEWAPLPVQYADYAVWQRELLGSADDPDSLVSRQLAHWTGTLAGLPDELPLPADFPRPEVSSNSGGEVMFELDAKLYATLVETARRSGATEFMVMQAAFAALLTKLGAGTDIPVGSSIAGRTDDALGDLVGFFINSLVLRTDTSGDPAFTELLARVRETDLAAYSCQDVPFEQIVDALNPARSLARHPLFQVMLTLQNNEEAPLVLPGLTVRPEFVESGRIKVDLSLQLLEWPEDGSMRGLLGYSTDLFTRETAERIVAGFVRLLEAVAADPEVRLSRLQVMGEDERAQVLTGWNDTARELPAATLPELFAAQAARTPDATAVVADSGSLTYAELDTRSNRLARHLLDCGAGPEQVVAVALPRSPEAVVAVLGVLKSGAAYQPVESGDPVERLKGMFAEAAPVRVVTTAGLARRMLATGVTPVVVDGPAVAKASEEPPADVDRPVPLLPAHPAYVIYTAGSAGRPRGTVVEHRSVTNYLAWARETYPSAASDALLASPLSFDISVTGLFLPLLTGGTVRLGELAEGDAVAGAGAALFKGTPSHLTLLDVLPDGCSPRADLVLADEPVPADRLQEWRAQHPAVRVVTEFGPTEATVGALSSVVEPGQEAGAGVLPLGRPVWNTRAYVLDPWLAPVAPGVTGELYLAGAGLARGYAADPAGTAERFVADPWGPAGSRMFRTGDLAKWDADGLLHHAGRADDQVRIRGFRIGLGEVESVIARQAGVERAVVVAREDVPGDPRLVAYVVPAAGSAVDTAALAGAAESELAHYMAPSAYVVLDALPLTPGGQVDRAALPVPGAAEAAGGTAPRDATEETLHGIVTEVLGVSGFGVEHNLFDAGMDSMKSLRLVSGARKAGLEITIADVFVHQSVEALAGACRPEPAVVEPDPAPRSGAEVMAEVIGASAELDYADPFSAMLCIKPTGDRPPVFCLHSGVGFSLPYMPLAQHLGEEHPIYGIQAPCVVDFAPLPGSIEEIATDYIRMIKQVRPEGPYHLLGWSFGGTIAYEIAVQLRAAGDEVGVLSVLDAYPRTGVPDDRDEQSLFAWLLEGIGHHRSEFGDRELTIQDIFGTLRRDNSPLAEMGEDRMARMVDLMSHHQTLKSLYAPGRYDGRMQLFVSESPLSDGEQANKVGLWEPVFDGPMDVHHIACTHDDMMGPGPLSEIGPAVAAELDRWHTEREGGR